MKHRWRAFAVLVCVLACGSTAWAWTVVGEGIEYQEYTINGPNNVFVARMDRGNPAVLIDSSIGQGKLSGGTERTSSQASRYDDAINYWGGSWGQRNKVVVAINGSYFGGDGVPFSGVIHSGWYAKRYDNMGGQSGFVWQLDRDAFIGECVTHVADRQIITFLPDGNTEKFQGINIPRGSDQLIVYTSQYDATTRTDDTGVEVLVEMSQPAMLMPKPAMITGVVRAVYRDRGSTPIPFDHVVLSATGGRAQTLLANASVGGQIGISQEIRSFARDCSTSRGLDWTKSYGAVSGNWVFLKDNVIQYGIDPNNARHPRTAIAMNDDYIFFVVVDGRSSASIGMTINELAEFCRNTLGATWGLNQDGGGSSTMVVNGEIRNVPSDGTERAVSNGLMMINLRPPLQSSSHTVGDTVETGSIPRHLRAGPGTNHAVLASLPPHATGVVVDHPLGGIYATAAYWWKCDFDGTVGWVALASVPAITQQPVDQAVKHGAVATFTVEADGLEPLSYRWQKNDSDLNDDGHYAGVLTDQLTVSGADKTDQATYRCVVAGTGGNTTSDAARLRVITPDFDGDLDVDQQDFGYLQACFGQYHLQGTECADADLAGIDGVNMDDFLVFQRCMSGEGTPIDPSCME